MTSSGKTSRAKASVKTTLSLPAEAADLLRQLAESRNVTLADVVRRALSIDKYLDDARKDGSRILIEDAEKKGVKELVIF